MSLLPLIEEVQLLCQMFHSRLFPKNGAWLLIIEKSRAKGLVPSVQDYIHETFEAFVIEPGLAMGRVEQGPSFSVEDSATGVVQSEPRKRATGA